ncbi:MAG TPA: allantoicase [Longimicrobium sp.]|nr:allantoicase [Longimicrobium sp.]
MPDFTELVDLASERLGGTVIATNDEFFAPKEALLKATEPEWREDAYTERGKWMDGWETRRRREPGHDWAIIRLGVPGVVRGLVVDTSWFRGNFPEHCSVEACYVRGTPAPAELDAAEWIEILPRTPLQGNAPNRFDVGGGPRCTHLRLRIYPDGGVARLRVHGYAHADFPSFVLDRGGEVDLAAMENGGWVMVCSDMFYGHRQSMILPGRSLFMGDGWETRRRRGPGHDWAIVRLAAAGGIHRVEIDTDHFKGNAPDRCRLEGIHAPGADTDALVASTEWRTLLPETKLQPHTRFRWEDEVADVGPVTHVRLSIHPDGGIARMRLFGTLADPER